MVDGYVVDARILRDYPDIPLVKVPSVKAGLELLRQGDVFALLLAGLIVRNLLAFARQEQQAHRPARLHSVLPVAAGAS